MQSIWILVACASSAVHESVTEEPESIMFFEAEKSNIGAYDVPTVNVCDIEPESFDTPPLFGYTVTCTGFEAPLTFVTLKPCGEPAGGAWRVLHGNDELFESLNVTPSGQLK